jgi:hypothetical protein
VHLPQTRVNRPAIFRHLISGTGRKWLAMTAASCETGAKLIKAHKFTESSGRVNYRLGKFVIIGSCPRVAARVWIDGLDLRKLKVSQLRLKRHRVELATPARHTLSCG